MKNEKRISKMKSCRSVDDLMEGMFPSGMDSVFTSYPAKRRLTKEWIECYKEGIYKPEYKHDTPRQLAEDIYKPSWDDDTMLFQELRDAFVEWVENYANGNT